MKIMGRRNTSRPKQPGPGAKHAGTHGATSILFQQYDLLSGSSLFDARFYVDANPDIADLNLDPLTHYLEIGCHERRDPSPHFKTSYYLRQCKTQGEAPANPLLHYLTVGAARGLNPSPAPAGRRMNASAARAAHGIAAPGARSAHQKASERHLYVDWESAGPMWPPSIRPGRARCRAGLPRMFLPAHSSGDAASSP